MVTLEAVLIIGVNTACCSSTDTSVVVQIECGYLYSAVTISILLDKLSLELCFNLGLLLIC